MEVLPSPLQMFPERQPKRCFTYIILGKILVDVRTQAVLELSMLRSNTVFNFSRRTFGVQLLTLLVRLENKPIPIKVNERITSVPALEFTWLC